MLKCLRAANIARERERGEADGRFQAEDAMSDRAC
jgi:hypothetical protein